MTDGDTTEQKSAVIESTTKLLDQLHEQIDRVRVQADLGRLDVRDEAAKQLNIAQNAYLAAQSELRAAGHDLAVTAEALRQGVEKLVRDVQKAIKAAEEAISRS